MDETYVKVKGKMEISLYRAVDKAGKPSLTMHPNLRGSCVSKINPYAIGTSGEEGVFTIPEFRFESGEVLVDMKVGYVAHGEINTKRDNIVLVTPGTGNTRHGFDGYIGPGQALDPAKYFIIAVDAIGGGTSSNPGDGLGGCFPHYTIRDMVRAQVELISSKFGPSPAGLRAIVGASMGAFQALEWGIHYPHLADALVLLVPAPRTTNLFKSVVRQMIDIIELDPHWANGRYSEPPRRGLAAAGRHYFPWTVTDDYIDRLSPDQLQRELAASAARFSSWDAWSLIRRYEASCSHDVSLPFGHDMRRALTSIRARTLVMPSMTDRLLPLGVAHEIAQFAGNVRYVEVPSQCGHLGWRPVAGTLEKQFITREIEGFLNIAGR